MMTRRVLAMILIGVPGAASLVAASAPPEAVSPGWTAGEALIADRCPNFLWGAEGPADAVELIVFRLPETGEAEGPGSVEQVLRVTLPGAARGWQPSLESCLDRGSRYAWAVRTRSNDEASEWSEARMFQVIRSSGGVEAGAPPALARDPRKEADEPRAGRPGASRDRSEPTSGAPTMVGRPAGAGGAASAGRANKGPDPKVIWVPLYSLQINGDLGLDDASEVLMGGEVFLWGDQGGISRNSGFGVGALNINTSGSDNLGVGDGALASDTNGTSNTALGAVALYNNTMGHNNTAVGSTALYSNVDGGDNTAVGNSALIANYGSRNTVVGSFAQSESVQTDENTAVGFKALQYINGNGNTALGAWAHSQKTGGSLNTALGRYALDQNEGSRNIAVGEAAGYDATTGNDNIYIGNRGVAAEGNTIRIGGGPGTGIGEQNRVFIPAILNQGVTSVHPVYVDANGQLGNTTSSRRYKDEIRDMGTASERLLELRPVTFRYKPRDRSAGEPERDVRPLEYGLIAEEVEEVMPDLVSYDEAGQPASVRYHLLSSMLLNELQKLQRKVRELEARLATLQRVVTEGDGPGGTSASGP